VVLVLAGIAGVLAAVLPARRASRLNVLDALAYE
jgi:putative ABC transport system permease protein